MQRSHNTGPDIVSKFLRTKMFAFEIEIGDLLQRIEDAQPGVEFQAVDDLNIVSEPDMLGAQVPVSVDNTPPLQPVEQQGLPFRNKFPQQTVESANGAPR